MCVKKAIGKPGFYCVECSHNCIFNSYHAPSFKFHLNTSYLLSVSIQTAQLQG